MSRNNAKVARPTLLNGYFFWAIVFVLLAQLGVFSTVKEWVSLQLTINKKPATVQVMNVNEEVPVVVQEEQEITVNDTLAASSEETVESLPFLEEGAQFTCLITDKKIYCEAGRNQEWLDQYVQPDASYTERRGTSNGRCIMGHNYSSGMIASTQTDELTIVYNDEEYNFECVAHTVGTNEESHILACFEENEQKINVEIEEAIDRYSCDLAVYTCQGIDGYDIYVSLWKLVD